ncbi:MAG: biotin--[acetyl-CoA-carboxylase] ligase [Bacteroidetes bacterium]|nr:MAG: biotin--[acetyl-CoA-carboxylase] ligase [Bacteroidota bacterium]
MLEKERILNGLVTREFGRTIHSFDRIDSTNTFGKRIDPSDAPHGTLIIAEEQTAGRGRLQRSWESDPGTNLLFSLILYPAFDAEKYRLLPFAASLAAADAVERVTGLSVSCKWPNDILIGTKKVCGMLLESVTGNRGVTRIVLGIGLNVNQEQFPEELRFKATSLVLETGAAADRIVLLQAVLEELEVRYEQLERYPPQTLLDDWKMKALIFGKKITVLESEFAYDAVAIDLAEDGALIVRPADGPVKRIYAGDVSIAYQ